MEETAPNRESSALLTIDVQRDFYLPGRPAGVAGTRDAIPAMAQVVDSFRRNGRPIIHVVRLYQPDGSNADLARKALIKEGLQLVAPGSDGADLAEELKPDASLRLDAGQLLGGALQHVGEAEWIMYKPRWGAFFETPLAEFLSQLGVDSLIVCGCNFPNCPRTTIYEASERDFRIGLVSDATSALYDRGKTELSNIGVHLFTARDCAQWIAGRTEYRTR